MEKKRVIEKLRELKLRASVKSGREYDPSQGWLENAIEQHNLHPFHAIIAAQTNENKSVVSVDELDENQPLLKCRRDYKVIRTGDQIARALTPLLLHTRTVLFVDPYFDVSKAGIRETLKCCLNTFATNGSEGLRCEVHFGSMNGMPDTPSIERNVSIWLDGVIPDGMSVVFHTWMRKENGEDFHDRYLLTERGGVKLGAGFIAQGNHQTVNMSLLDVNFCENEQANFKRNTTVYDLVEPVIEVFFDGRVVHI